MSDKSEELLTAIQSELKTLGSNIAQLATEAGKSAAAGLEAAKESACQMARDLPENSRQAAESVDRAVKENPYKAVGIAAAAGLLVGALLNRR